jgi:hypothetical protein
MMRVMRPSPLPGCLLALVACASSPPPAAAPPADIAAPTASPAPAPAPATAEAPATAPQRPLELANACSHEMRLYYGDHPGDGKGENVTVAAGATIPVPRRPDATQVVWVVDEMGNGLGHVTITKNMRHIRIDPACMHIDADSTR